MIFNEQAIITGAVTAPPYWEKMMKTFRLNLKPLCVALLAAGFLSACGGGGGGDGTAPSSGTTTPGGTTPGGTTPGGTTPGGTTPGGTTPGTTPDTTTPGGTTPGTTTPSGTPAPVPATASMVMSCPGGASVQCSGDTIIRTENGVALTSSGVQAYGRSTSDLANPIVVRTGASGFEPASGGVAEIRITKDADARPSAPIVILRNLGLTWDNKVDRPPIVETFNTTQGRTILAADGTVSSAALPGPTDLGYYNFATLGPAATQLNYANNRYFPRADPSRCAADVVPCPTAETAGTRLSPGEWRTGNAAWPDNLYASRLHEDGDIHAGNATPGSTPAWLEGGNGIGIPFPGSKGYRGFDNWNLRYTNLGAWVTQDTVVIEEWARAGDEHNKNRRGVVTYGAVTDPATVPATGTATYTGFSYGWYSPNRAADPSVFRGTATITVNFATRQVTVAVQNTNTNEEPSAVVPVAFSTTASMGAANTNVANYLTGAVTAGNLSGGLGGRYFGPVTGGAPAEMGGTFQMNNAATGQMVVGGFMAVRRVQ
ncbi:HupA family protein [Noviherbaspirillum aerium]|uniref:hypothetical protein n=1 Tax=Noviherbaspirillum aerium TaxID=2588497 RepID=UPI00178C69F7|nr:hypothetical protein [Noviherbaspirillum aerium]